MALYDTDTRIDPVNWDEILQRGGATGTTTPPTPTPAPAATPAPSADGDRRAGIASAYQQYLGRAPQEYEYGWWMGNPNFQAGIQNSPEAQARTRGEAYRPTYNAIEGTDARKMNDLSWNTPKYTAARILSAGGNIQQAAQAVGGTVVDATRFRLPTGEIIDTRRDEEGANRLQWLVLGQGANAGNGYTTPGMGGAATAGTGGAGAGEGGWTGERPGFRAPSAQGSAFSDPATAQWEQLLRTMVDRLNSPVPQSTLELQQTQALDPLERQRQQQRQQTALRLSQRGITQGSGVFEQAMQDIDRQFTELRTRTQAGFANTAAQQAEERALAGVNLFGQIPQYQDRRLQLAQQTLMPANPMQLLNLQQNYQQMAQQNQMYQNAQNQQFWQWLIGLRSEAFQ